MLGGLLKEPVSEQNVSEQNPDTVVAMCNICVLYINTGPKVYYDKKGVRPSTCHFARCPILDRGHKRGVASQLL